MKRDQIGLQMYTLREQAATDLDATLASVAKMGYTGVEFAGFQGHSAEDVRRMLDEYGLKAFAAHIPVAEFEGDIEQVVSDLTTIGAGWGVVPWISPEDRTEEYLTQLGLKMNGFASRLKLDDLKFAYHNHDFEFAMTTSDGETLFKRLTELTEPELVWFELDVLWAAAGGYEPAGVIEGFSDRIRLLHIKDGAKDDLHKDLPVGEGVLDWGAILGAARKANVEYYIVEQDHPNPDDPEADVLTSLQNAEGMAE